MKESIRSEKKWPWIKKGEIGSTLFRSCIGVIFIMSALIIGALVNYEGMHRYYQKYCTKKEKVEYQVVKCAEKEQGKYYLCLRNLKTRKKIMKECDFNDYTLYEPGDKITYNLTKAQLSDQGEYKIDEDNEVYWIWLTIILGSIFIVVLSFTMLAQNENATKYEERLVKITVAYDILIIIIAIVEMVLL